MTSIMPSAFACAISIRPKGFLWIKESSPAKSPQPNMSGIVIGLVKGNQWLAEETRRYWL